MVRKEYVTEKREHMRDGAGTVTINNWLAAEEKFPNLRLAAKLELPPGASIGEHTHEGESEVFNIVAGSGEYDDNGKKVNVGPGDVMVCYSGDAHSIKNIGDETLIINAVIVTGG